MTWSSGTAVVTGASSGIGAEFADQLAKRGCDLVLTARRESRLSELAATLRERHGVRVEVIPADLATVAGVQDLVEVLRERQLEVEILVNNAGFGTHGRFVEEDPVRIADEVALNVAAVVALTRALLPGMVERGHGTVVNVASTASFQPLANMAVYGATKAFVRSFTEALWGELEGSGVRALTLCPGATETEFFDVAGEDAAVGSKQTAAQVVATALRELDRRRPRPTVVSGLGNALAARLTPALPRRLVIRVVRRMVLAPAQ